MNQAEQESLLLRQVAALRRRGHSHVQALELAAAGLPFGALADRVRVALRTLSEGEPVEGSTDPLQAPGAVDSLDHAARAIEARLAADSSLTAVRLYLSIAIAGPLLILTAIAWIAHPALEANGGLALVADMVGVIRVGGVPAALLAAWVLGRSTRRLAPGFNTLRRAAALLDAAATDSDPLFALDNGGEVAYFAARRATVGARQAAVDLADELVGEGEHAVARFRHLAPLALVVIGVPLLWLVWIALYAIPTGAAMGGI